MKLVKTIAQIRKASSINVSNDISNYASYIEEAEESFIRPAIGDDAFSLFASITEGESGSGGEELTEAYDQIVKATSLYALWCGADEIAIRVGANGMVVINSEKEKPAPGFMIQNIKENWMRRAHVALDIALKKMIILGIDNPSSLYDMLIGCEEDFSKHLFINGSRRVYIMLRPYIRSIEQKYIIPAISQDLYDYLLRKYAENQLNGLEADEKKLMWKLQPCIAHLAMARALQEISVDKIDWGVFEMSNSNFTRITDRATVNRDRVERMIQVNEDDGNAELKGIIDFLNANASESVYAEYFSSDLYKTAAVIEEESETDYTRRKNAGNVVM